MTSDWQRLARMAALRRAELDLTQIEVAQRGSLSIDRVQAIEGAKRDRYRLGTLAALERALKWENGSVAAILAGGDPETLAERWTEAEQARRPQTPDERLAAARERLRRYVDEIREEDVQAAERMLKGLTDRDTA